MQNISPFPETSQNLIATGSQFELKVLLLGESIDLTAFGGSNRSVTTPHLFIYEQQVLAAVFRCGAVVIANFSPEQEQSFVKLVQPQVNNVYDKTIVETIDAQLVPQRADDVRDGILHLKEISFARFEVIAEVMAKSVKLEFQEDLISKRFEHIKPIANNIAVNGKVGVRDRSLIKYIGGNLISEHELAGRMEITEKPALLWENPELEPLYAQILDEFEIIERQQIVDRKIELISRTAQMYLEVSQHRHGLRLEWYITILIALEIVLELYSLFFKA